MRFQNRVVYTSVVLASTLAATTGIARAEDYTVKKGDTLWAIAMKHKVTLAAVIRANPQIKNPNLIFPGQVVHIPKSQSTPNNNPAHATKPVTKPKPPALPTLVVSPPVATTPPPVKPPVTPPKPPVVKPPVTPPVTPPTTPSTPAFVFNFGGPDIQVSSPARGAQVATGNVVVKGKATDKDGIQLVTVNGAPATLAADGSFMGMASLKEGANVIEIRATSKKNKTTDAQIGVLAGTFGSNVREAAAARVSNEALRVGTNAIEPLLVQDLKALAGKPIADYSVSPFGGVKIETKVTLGSITLSQPNVDVVATTKGLDADLGVKNLDIKLPIQVKASIFGANLGFTHTLDLHFDRFAASGLLDLNKQASGALDVDAGNLRVDYYPTVVGSIIGQKTVDELNKLLGNISGAIPGAPKLKFDEVAIVNKVIEMVWKNGLKNTAETRIAKMITTPGLTGVTMQLGPQKATIKYNLNTVDVDAGGFTLTTGLDVNLAGPNVHASKGALLVGNAPPKLTGATGLKVAAAQDLVNSLLEEGWRKGLLDKTIDKNIAQQTGMLLNAANLGLLVPALTGFIPKNADLEISVKPGAAPFAKLTQGGKATVSVTELVVGVAVVLGNTRVDLFTVDVHATVPATFSYSNGNLVVKLEKTKFTFDIRKSVVPLPKIAVETALGFVVPIAVDFAAGKFLGPIPLPTPKVAGVTPTVTSLTTSGAKGEFVEVDLKVK